MNAIIISIELSFKIQMFKKAPFTINKNNALNINNSFNQEQEELDKMLTSLTFCCIMYSAPEGDMNPHLYQKNQIQINIEPF